MMTAAIISFLYCFIGSITYGVGVIKFGGIEGFYTVRKFEILSPAQVWGNNFRNLADIFSWLLGSSNLDKDRQVWRMAHSENFFIIKDPKSNGIFYK